MKRINLDKFGTILDTGSVKKVIASVYECSIPVGMGMMHFVPGPIPPDVLESLVETFNEKEQLSMDYVLGRCCKAYLSLTEDNKIHVDFTVDDWFDHSEDQTLKFFELIKG